MSEASFDGRASKKFDGRASRAFDGRASRSNFDGKTSLMTQKRQVQEEETLKLHAKTFKAWMNAHLKQCGVRVIDIKKDLQDGLIIIALMEILTGTKCKAKYHTRPTKDIHKIENCAIAIDFVKQFINVNVAAKDISEGNIKIILGLIWRLILQYQVLERELPDAGGPSTATATAVSVGDGSSSGGEPITQKSVTVRTREAKQKLLEWLRTKTAGYDGVKIDNFDTSFQDGLAFCALVHAFDPNLIDYNSLDKNDVKGNLEKAFTLAEEHMGVPQVIDTIDMINPDPDLRPDEQCIMTYLSDFPRAFLAKLESNKDGIDNTEALKKSRDSKRLSRRSHLLAPIPQESNENSLSFESGKRLGFGGERSSMYGDGSGDGDGDQSGLSRETGTGGEGGDHDHHNDHDNHHDRDGDGSGGAGGMQIPEIIEEQEMIPGIQFAEIGYLAGAPIGSAQFSVAEVFSGPEIGIAQEFTVPPLEVVQPRMELPDLGPPPELPNLQQAMSEAEMLRLQIEKERLEAELRRLRTRLIGTLTVGVIEARGLMGLDLRGKSDPYAILTVERQREKTKKVLNTINPKWDAGFKFYVSESDAVLHIVLYDWDRFLPDAFLGKLDIPIVDLPDGKLVERWYTLLPKKPGRKVSGEINLRILYQLKS